MQTHRDILATRIREIRSQKFGANGVAILAGYLEIPERTWDHYGTGVMIPGCVLLKLIELTGVEPHWLLTGVGERYSTRSSKSAQRASQ